MPNATPVILSTSGNATPVSVLASGGRATPVVAAANGNATPITYSTSGSATPIYYIGATPEALSWKDAVIANGGTVSDERLAIISQFIASEMALGAWALVDDYAVLAAENAPQALTTLKRRATMAPTAAPIFADSRGYTFNGTTQFIATTFVPSTMAVAMTPGNYRMGVYCLTNEAASTANSMGVSNAVSSLRLNPRTGTDTIAGSLHSSTGQFAAITDSRGLTATSRAANSTTLKGYKNGVALADATVTVQDSTLINLGLVIGASNTNGTVDTFRPGTISFAEWGGPFTGTPMELSHYNNVFALLSAVGAYIDPDVELWAAAVVVNGGTVSTARQIALTAFVTAEKAAGTWALTDDYCVWWAENQIQALTSLKQRRLGTVSGAPAPTFRANQGFSTDGTQNFVNTGFVPSTHAVAMTVNSSRAAIYNERATDSSNNTAMGTNSNTNRQIRLSVKTATTTTSGGAMGTNISFTSTSPDARGLSVIARTGAALTDVAFYRNAVSFPRTSDPTAIGATLPAHAFYVGALDNAGVTSSLSIVDAGFACVGASFTPALELAQYTNVMALRATIGAYVDPDVELWAAAVAVNGGTVSAARKSILTEFVAQERTNLTWTPTDDYWVLWAENEIQALTSLKQRRLAVAVGSPVFKANIGYTFNGNNYINTGWIAATHSVSQTLASSRLAVYEMTDASVGVSIGAYSGSVSQILSMRARGSDAGDTSVAQNQVNGTGPGGQTSVRPAPLTSVGFTVARRGTSVLTTAPAIYIGGIPRVLVTPWTALNTTLVSHSLFIGGLNSEGVFTDGRPVTMGFACASSSLQDAREVAQAANVTWLGRAVGALP